MAQVLHRPADRGDGGSSPSSGDHRFVAIAAQLPIAQYPNIAPPRCFDRNYREPRGALEQVSGHAHRTADERVATCSTCTRPARPAHRDASPGEFRHHYRSNIDQVLVNMRYSQASSQLPQDVVNQGVTVKKSVLSPLALFILHSPKAPTTSSSSATTAYVNLNDPMTRVPGIGQVTVFGANKYAPFGSGSIPTPWPSSTSR